MDKCRSTGRYSLRCELTCRAVLEGVAGHILPCGASEWAAGDIGKLFLPKRNDCPHAFRGCAKARGETYEQPPRAPWHGVFFS